MSSKAVEALPQRSTCYRLRWPSSRRGGFVLVMALALILLAGFLLACIARQSLDAALETIRARQDLQRRWGAISCQHLLLDDADGYFQRLQEDNQAAAILETPVAPAVQIKLGELTFNLRLADENCKINLNTVYALRGEEAVARVCREATTVLQSEMRIPAQENSRPFSTWSQVFALADANAGVTSAQLLADATTNLTCWGNGRINLRRAPDDVVRAVGRLAVSSKVIRELLAVRKQYPDAEMQDWVKALSLSPQERTKLQKLFCEESLCYSLWIETISPERTWNEFIVVESSPDAANKVSRFVW